MARPKLAIDRCWVEKELKPYLRCTFSHALRYDADIGPQIESAIDFCMYKPVGSTYVPPCSHLTAGQDYPTDAGGYDLIFERICLAIDRRDLDYAPDLALVTEHLEPLAKFLIRRAQLKGPYTLLGRMNIGSGAWREYQAKRLDDQRGAEDDKGALSLLALHGERLTIPSTSARRRTCRFKTCAHCGTNRSTPYQCTARSTCIVECPRHAHSG
jgi:hypothetical protein